MFRVARRSTIPEIRPDFTPLIDVVFLLLTFFIFSMVLMVRAQVLDVRLPEVASGPGADADAALTITVDADGRVFLDRVPVPLTELAQAVRARQAERGGASGSDQARPRLLLAVDELGRAGDLIRVADTLAAAGITEFSILGTPPRPSPEVEQ
jgi:biopolymer transport protein ExbD